MSAKTGSRPALTERRAEFVYEGARIAAIAARCPVIPEPWGEREEAFRAQFLDVIEKQMGPDRSDSPEELHGTWVEAYLAMGWQYGPERDPKRKRHPDLVPYDDLGQLERDKDAVFVALCEIARLWIYDDPIDGGSGPPAADSGDGSKLRHLLFRVALAVTNPDRDHVDRCVDVLGIVGSADDWKAVR